MAGYTYGSLDGQTFSGGTDAFLTEYDANGTKAWTRLLGTSSFDDAHALTTGSDGAIYMAGYTPGSLDGQTNSGGGGGEEGPVSLPVSIATRTILVTPALGGSAPGHWLN